jgi:serine protease Do
MRNPVIKPFAFIMLFTMMVSLACSLTNSGSTPTATVAAATTSPSTAIVPTLGIQTTATDMVPSGLVTSLDGVQSATIQIQSEGTFIDPEVGLMVNAAGRGSGFFINSDGMAITNNHVVTGAALLRVWVGGDSGKEYDARVVAVSECSDLAVIQVDGSDFPYLQWLNEEPKVGLQVYAAGYPLGEPQFSLTQGIISKTAAPGASSWASVSNVLTHDATLNPGNSGGPLVDADGKIVGINYAANGANQYFAIGKTEADKILKDLEAGTDVTSIGINGEAVSGTLSDGSTISGIWVSSVKSGSPADLAGVKAGDIIYQMEGEVLATDGTMETYCKILRSHLSSDNLSINVLRYSTNELLEGQLNGRALTVTSSFFQDQLGNETTSGGSSTTGGYTNYVTVTDDTSSIQVQIPEEWTDIDGAAWTANWTLDNGSSYRSC